MEIPSLSKKQATLLLRACLSYCGVRLRGGQHRTARSLQAMKLGRTRVERRFGDPDVVFFFASKAGLRVAPHVLPERKADDPAAIRNGLRRLRTDA